LAGTSAAGIASFAALVGSLLWWHLVASSVAADHTKVSLEVLGDLPLLLEGRDLLLQGWTDDLVLLKVDFFLI
jgi:hypothetical protein